MPAVRRLDISKKDAKVCVRVAGAGRRKTVETVTTRGSMMSQILALALPTLAPAPPTLSASTDGQPFTARPGTPNADAEPRLLAHTPTRPSRRVWAGPTSKVVCDQYHDYRAEQLAFHGGAMDRLVEYTETTSFTPPILTAPGMVMDFYDGNTVIALWNYAQHYAMNDNSYNIIFGRSAPSALKLISGQTHGVNKEFMPGGKRFPLTR
jgi:phospholipase C